jgi:pyrimidine operon attenuation protein / uracil phosphoribosyltransferase
MQTISNSSEIDELVRQLAAAIAQRHPTQEPALIGIEKRGVFLAQRVAQALRDGHGDRWKKAPLGTLDISLYRDDLGGLRRVPELRGSRIDFDVDGRTVILFDDVLYTGRTIRAALEELMDFGRPACVELAVLLDRGLRELPISANYVGLCRPTDASDYIRVRLHEHDGEDGIFLGKKEHHA